MRNGTFWIAAAAVGIAFVVLTRLFFTNEYYFFAAYVVLQYVVLSTAWNILGGYTGYINSAPARSSRSAPTVRRCCTRCRR